MGKKEFNESCAKYMGYNAYWSKSYQSLMIEGLPHTKLSGFTNPYDDLNQMAEVAEKMFTELSLKTGLNDVLLWARLMRRMTDAEITVKRAFRDFITDRLTHETPRGR